MTKYLSTLLVLLLACPVLDADAQFKRLRDRAKKRAKEKIERRADREVDKAVDKSMDEAERRGRDAIEGLFDGDDSEFAAELDLGPIESGSANADYLTYSETSQIWFPGMKFLSRFSKDVGKPSVTKRYYTKTRSRSDDGDASSSIMDASNMSMTHIDHEEKKFFTYNFDEMMDAATSATQQAQEEMDVDTEEMEQSIEEADVKFDFNVEVRNTGTPENILGVNAKQVIVIIETKASAQNPETMERHRGRFFTILDTWKSEEVAGQNVVADFGRTMMNGMRGPDMFQNDQQPFAGLPIDGRITDSFQKAAEELEKIPGFDVRTGTYFVLVPEGQELDVELAMESTGASLADLGQTEGEPAKQSTVMRSITHIHDLHTQPHPSGLFSPDTSTYTEIDPLAMFMTPAEDEQ